MLFPPPIMKRNLVDHLVPSLGADVFLHNFVNCHGGNTWNSSESTPAALPHRHVLDDDCHITQVIGKFASNYVHLTATLVTQAILLEPFLRCRHDDPPYLIRILRCGVSHNETAGRYIVIIKIWVAWSY